MVARQVTRHTPHQWHERAIAAERAGDPALACGFIGQALAQWPDNADLHNDGGSLALRMGEAADAESLFACAQKLAPDNPDFAINRAIALGRLDRHEEACGLLTGIEGQAAELPRYWSARGNAARAARKMEDAARSYERCLALEPQHPRGLHGRARVAIERGESDAETRFDTALALNPGEPDLWLGKAQALDVAGQSQAARQIMEQVTAQAPGWLEGLKFLAQLKLAAGESDFAGHYREAARRQPADPNIPRAHAEILAGLDHAPQAAQVASEARIRFPQDIGFALLEAVHAGSAGDDARAEAIFAGLALETPQRWIQEARHRIRTGEPERAGALLERALAIEPWNIAAWALRDIVWRLTDDPRAGWLHGQEGMVQRLRLQGSDDLIDRCIIQLRELHAHSPLPLGQSLRGGTQTRGILFDRTEPVLAELHAAILAIIEDYRAGLPQPDPAHPLLRHAAAPLRLAGSWSVRLTGGGDHHTAHIHPQGVLSSALYLVVPEDARGERQSGWLEVGRPPPDLRCDLAPLATIRPEPGHLALFPSTLYHGTTRFGDKERMTAAFDVVPAAAQSP
ncbi:MAG: tetratricopeptide repeat protein [Alphaproteobacteria bacterium]|nr:tetratricopeptide repeat protein [Alphaproteobacteria bacterium]